MEPALHPDVEPIAFLFGTWRGEGDGDWPTSGPFRYGEEMTFEHVGKAFLLYSQRSWTAEERSPLHFERGFLRLAGPGRVEVVLARPLGIVEVAEGPVTELRRRMEVQGDVLRYELLMAMRDVPLTRHLNGELRRA